ncbi:MAG: acyltransferase family protein [Bacteroidia bacterium]
MANRRYDIDWIRVIAIWLLVFYHVAISFRPWGTLIGFIQHNTSLDALEIPMSLLSIWRIPLLFFVSGMGVCFAMRKRNWLELWKERAQRILLPFGFGIFAIVPLHVWLWRVYYHQDAIYDPNPAHLWFLGNILIYVLLLTPLFLYLKRQQDKAVGLAISKVMGHPLGLLLLILPFVLEAVLVNPDAFVLYAQTAHGFWLGLFAFLLGYLMVYAGQSFWELLGRWKWVLLAGAVALFLLRLFYFDLAAPNALLAVESNLWVFALLGIGYRYLNRSHPALSYLSQAAYPVYILHMFFLYLTSFLIFPTQISGWWAFSLVIVLTFVGCYATFELVRRIKWLRPLFGLKIVNKKEITPNPIISQSAKNEA